MYKKRFLQYFVMSRITCIFFISELCGKIYSILYCTYVVIILHTIAYSNKWWSCETAEKILITGIKSISVCPTKVLWCEKH